MKFLVALFLSILTSTTTLGEEEDIYTLFKGVNSLKILFSQRTKLPVAGDEVSLYEGVIYYKRPLKFRWEYTKGVKVLIVSNGELVKSSIEGECQIAEIADQPVFALIELIDNPEKFKEEFRVKELKKNKSWEVVRITPNYKDAFFKEITFIIKDKKLKKVITVEEDGTKGEYQIEEIENNVPLDDDLFRVTPCN
ncbi:MAG: outer membrane lipoprotein carrier protein LolA [Desulfurobacteriaceae bacterium]